MHEVRLRAWSPQTWATSRTRAGGRLRPSRRGAREQGCGGRGPRRGGAWPGGAAAGGALREPRPAERRTARWPRPAVTHRELARPCRRTRRRTPRARPLYPPRLARAPPPPGRPAAPTSPGGRARALALGGRRRRAARGAYCPGSAPSTWRSPSSSAAALRVCAGGRSARRRAGRVLTINELRLRIGPRAGRPAAGPAPWLPVGGVRARSRGARAGRGAGRRRRGRAWAGGRPLGPGGAEQVPGGVTDVAQRTRGSPERRGCAQKNGVHELSRCRWGSGRCALAPAAGRPFVGVGEGALRHAAGPPSPRDGRSLGPQPRPLRARCGGSLWAPTATGAGAPLDARWERRPARVAQLVERPPL